jgi:hypothetical protein
MSRSIARSPDLGLRLRLSRADVGEVAVGWWNPATGGYDLGSDVTPAYLAYEWQTHLDDVHVALVSGAGGRAITWATSWRPVEPSGLLRVKVWIAGPALVAMPQRELGQWMECRHGGVLEAVATLHGPGAAIQALPPIYLVVEDSGCSC